MNKLNFKYLFPNLFLFCICMNLTACSEKNSGGDNLQSGDEIISFEPDLNTLIRGYWRGSCGVPHRSLR